MTVIETPKSQYAQIADELRLRIENGTYPPGSLLPSEPRLAEELGVSRVTVNKAITLLRASGDVKVRRGSGTSVRSLPRIPRDAKRRYAARMEGTGAGQVEVNKLKLESLTKYREIGRVPAPQPIARTLGLRKSEDVLIRRRVLYANGEPTQIADSYYPWSIAKGSDALLREDAGQGGSYGRLAELGHAPVRFTEDVTVRVPDDAEQRTLELEATQPVFEIWHVAYAADDRPVEVCVHVMAGHLWTLRYGWDDDSAASVSP
ncbi:GntR family transcriptional regulator [Planosporangium mesophilum]|uniref:GntR family transcriptional regulator n=1 Tax=Planosporangium mesophilum TaxID=689768 RepID=A0A8J3TIM7_9ACTN|nr:GntR family transcriptional regulator [Planosporangium mesophilum]NJC83683.1 GntR family transcriptional regulator [Planosporangium mesophilum]GII25349.1 GntR family transcriptional regulator [Planosporangium mesophilum]